MIQNRNKSPFSCQINILHGAGYHQSYRFLFPVIIYDWHLRNAQYTYHRNVRPVLPTLLCIHYPPFPTFSRCFVINFSLAPALNKRISLASFTIANMAAPATLRIQILFDRRYSLRLRHDDPCASANIILRCETKGALFK